MFVLVHKPTREVRGASNFPLRLPKDETTDYEVVEIAGDTATYVWPGGNPPSSLLGVDGKVTANLALPAKTPSKKDIALTKLDDASKAQGVNAKIADALTALKDFLSQ